MNARRKVTPVILSGGAGTRLWPLSRTEKPKQFLSFTEGGTMLELTLQRSQGKDVFNEPVIVCSTDHAGQVESQSGGSAPQLILEPAARNTAPAIALAALALPEDSLMLVSPSDHAITNVRAFHRAIDDAIPFAEDGWLVTFGIMPTRPETGYGYIRRGEALGEGAYAVERFVEKPDAATAQAYLDEGCYSWNAGIFLFRAGVFLAELGKYAPEMLAAAREAMASARHDGKRTYPDAAAFAAAPSNSIDYAVMEKAEKVAVVPVDMGWSDIGSWDALYDLLDKDGADNVCLGEVIANGSSGCLVRSDGPVVAVSGLKDIVVIATGDAVLVLPRGSSQDVKTIVDQLKDRKHPTLTR